MKQLGLYLLYVAILFVIQMAVLGLLSFTDVAPGLTEVLYLFYFLPAGIIISIFMMVFGNESLNLLPQGGFFLAFLAGLVALIYALVPAAVIWAITFIVIRVRDRSLNA